MTEDSITWLLRIQESEEEEAEVPELPGRRDIGPAAGRETATRTETAAQTAAQAADPEVSPARERADRAADAGVPERETTPAGSAAEAAGTADASLRDALLVQRLYRSLVQAEQSVRLAFSPAGGSGGMQPAASIGTEGSAGSVWSAGSMWSAAPVRTAAGPAVSFHLDGLDARTMDEWFSRDARRYDATGLG